MTLPKRRELPGMGERPKRRKASTLQVVDGGELVGGGGKGWVLECRRCGHNTGWIPETRVRPLCVCQQD